MSDHAPHPSTSNFLRQIIERDLLQGRYHGRRWAGTPGDGTHQERGGVDPARVRMRFPPEPNGYLHVGHAKSIWLNFSLAQAYGGVCHMRFDDTNPDKEEQEYVDAILDAVRWLGWSWKAYGVDHLYYASDYFDFMYRAAEYLIETGHAYVDEQTPQQMRANRGTLTEPGIDSPYRSRPPQESLERFRQMRAGRFPDGAMVLRAKIDMASPNINLRDPTIYRIKHATHHNTGDAWCIYPMYTFAHPIEDALENITHSICTLEFEDQRPFYDWLLERIVPVLRAPQFERAKQLIERIEQQGVEAGKEFALHCHNHAYKLGLNTEPERRMRELFTRWEHDRDAVLRDLPAFFALLKTQAHQFTPLLASALDAYQIEPFNLPHQYEFARLNLTYVVTSKRKLKALVDEGIVSGWDDPRMPTIAGLRRRGYTPEAIRLFCERTGVSKAGGWIDYSNLETALRDDLEGKAPRAMAVLDPVKLKLSNWADVFGTIEHREPCTAPAHPQRPEFGQRRFSLGPEVWIEREDFIEQPPKGFFRLFPGNRVRLKYGYVIECTGCEKDDAGRVTAVLATVVPDTKSGTPGADAVKVKGTITWVGAHEGVPAEVRLYDRLFADPQPDAGGKDFKAALNPNSLKVVTGYVEPSLAGVQAGERFQFERHGYFCTDAKDHRPDRAVFNRIASLKDSWVK
ncbi:MAG: glutamine--tRNA ligase [Tepidimonas sp.]|uniref:glutamine--tRNA ligase n=1 Tax=Tepidimonas sp. TaxID=2002775 RepID=UPI004054BE71